MIGTLATLLLATGAQAWHTPAKLHRLLRKPVPAILAAGEDGIEFRSAALTRRWPYAEVRSYRSGRVRDQYIAADTASQALATDRAGLAAYESGLPLC